MTPGAPEDLPPQWPLAEFSQTAKIMPYRWHLADLGEGDEVLLLHGAGASAHSWGDLARILARSYRVLAPDLPGHGLTRARGMRAGLADMTTDLAALMAGIGSQPKVIIGHSAGGALALSLSQKLTTPPSAVIVLNGALEDFQGLAGFLFPLMARFLALNPLAAPFLARSAVNPAAIERLIRGTGSEISQDGLDRYRRLISDRRHVAGTLAMMASWSLAPLSRELPHIAVPVLFLHGEKDEAVAPDVAMRAAATIPNARIEVLDGLGHLIHEEAPSRIADRISAFLSGTPPG
ncbi:MAG: alpha/beta fold hydrolase BchO [Pseudomonadota bacterium]